LYSFFLLHHNFLKAILFKIAEVTKQKKNDGREVTMKLLSIFISVINQLDEQNFCLQ